MIAWKKKKKEKTLSETQNPKSKTQISQEKKRFIFYQVSKKQIFILLNDSHLRFTGGNQQNVCTYVGRIKNFSK